jgi:hypothetical protein
MNDLRDIIHDGVDANRASEKLRIVHSTRGGRTTWHKRKVISVAAPLQSGAHSRTIRLHEILHANRSPLRQCRKFPDLAVQAIEDARVHTVYWPTSMPKKANRDCLAAALLDSRTIPPMIAMASADDWNVNLLVALRSMAIVKRLGEQRHATKLQSRLQAAFGPVIVEKLGGILSLVKSHKTQALRKFSALLRSDDDADNNDANQSGSGSTGESTNSPMQIVRLSMPESCNPAVRRMALARSGARLNRSRLARAVATGSTSGLFIRPRYLPGGTYLIDASGSMQLSADRLGELCRSAPVATVAYYSGWGSPDASGCYGKLVIYAENGRRATAVDHRYCGNEIDLFAIQWLLRQPAPRVYIGDAEFCGGPEGQDVKAAALLASAVASGKIEWQKSICALG